MGLVEQYGASAPDAIRSEAIIRTAGWLSEQPHAAITAEEQGDISTRYRANNINALKHSGAMSPPCAVPGLSCGPDTGGGRMRKLSPRRFPNTIIRQRTAPGYRNNVGVFVDGAISMTTFRASVQPVELEDIEQSSGTRAYQIA